MIFIANGRGVGFVLPQSSCAGGAAARFGLWKGPSVERGRSIRLLTKIPEVGVYVGARLLKAHYLSVGVCLLHYRRGNQGSERQLRPGLPGKGGGPRPGCFTAALAASSAPVGAAAQSEGAVAPTLGGPGPDVGAHVVIVVGIRVQKRERCCPQLTKGRMNSGLCSLVW